MCSSLNHINSIHFIDFVYFTLKYFSFENSSSELNAKINIFHENLLFSSWATYICSLTVNCLLVYCAHYLRMFFVASSISTACCCLDIWYLGIKYYQASVKILAITNMNFCINVFQMMGYIRIFAHMIYVSKFEKSN